MREFLEILLNVTMGVGVSIIGVLLVALAGVVGFNIAGDLGVVVGLAIGTILVITTVLFTLDRL